MRVTRCFAFLDLCGFSAYTEEHGDDQAVVVLAQLRTVLRTATERRGVRLTKWLGDGAMLSGVDAAAVMACVLETRHRLADCPLELRAGVCQGNVIMFEGDDYVGAAVNVAARLCEAADHNQVLVANVDSAQISWAHTRPLTPIVVPGLRNPVATAELVVRESRTRAPVIDPVCGLLLDPEADLLVVIGLDGDVHFCSPACRSSWEPASRV